MTPRRRTPKIIAHRRLTPSSINECIDYADSIEADLIETRDGELLIAHDITLLRQLGLSKLHKLIPRMTAAEAKDLHNKNGLEILTFGEFLDLMDERPDKEIILDPKGGPKGSYGAAQKAIQKLAKRPNCNYERFSIVSFNPETLNMARLCCTAEGIPQLRKIYVSGGNLSPASRSRSILLGLRCDGINTALPMLTTATSALRTAIDNRFDAIIIHTGNWPPQDFLESAQQADIEPIISAHNPRQLDWALKQNVNSIFTDEPKLAHEMRKEQCNTAIQALTDRTTICPDLGI